MAVNFTLKDRVDVDPTEDPMGRSWVGWDARISDQELWDTNRGVWSLSEARVREVRFATLSYDGVVRVAAEINGLEFYDEPRGPKQALTGEVLLPGDPAHDLLVGRPVPRNRNPVGYVDTSDVDNLSMAERAAFIEHPTATFLLTHNPERWRWDEDEYTEEVLATAAGTIVHGRWATGSRTSGIDAGDRAFMLRQGKAGRGIIGSGTFTSRIFLEEHWAEEREGEIANYALIDWDTLLEATEALPIERLVEIPGQHWEPQGSGTIVHEAPAKVLERIWAQHLGRPTPHRPTPRRGWQLDPKRRKKVEDAAQARLMREYFDRGYFVQDTHTGHPYDATAEKGEEVIYLEAKGTETEGRAVLVTPGEIAHARRHPGACVLGVLADVRFDATGEIDPDSGTFTIHPWAPDSGVLTPTGYSWEPPD